MTVRVKRRGKLRPLAALLPNENPYAFLKQATVHPAESGLSSRSLLGDLLGDPRARAILEREVPDLVHSSQIGMGSQMTLRALQPFVPNLLSDEVLDRIDQALKPK